MLASTVGVFRLDAIAQANQPALKRLPACPAAASRLQCFHLPMQSRPHKWKARLINVISHPERSRSMPRR